MPETFLLVHNPEQIDPQQWNALAEDNPLVRLEFLRGLHTTGCAASTTGWAPHFLLLQRAGRLVGAMPLYLKWHSRGEYVFDYVWARAFEQQGLDYYPKLLGAIPFSPVQGPRLLAHTHADKVLLAQKAIELANTNQLSSIHILFPHSDDLAALAEAGFVFRDTVQFHWHNQNHPQFDDFLASMSQKNRKKIRQDSKKVAQAGVDFEWLEGRHIDAATLQFFYQCYCQTYLERGQAPYLNLDFFKSLYQSMPESLVLIVARQHGQPIACALNLRSKSRLYGRYWGARKFISGLHFETCYTQGIRYSIAHGLEIFEGGAQGEHKLARGLLPVLTPSAHWVRDQRYAAAISDFVERESQMIDGYIDELHEHSPFKQQQGKL